MIPSARVNKTTLELKKVNSKMATPPFAGSPFIREMVKRDFKDDFQK
jgi:hypothetical protein